MGSAIIRDRSVMSLGTLLSLILAVQRPTGGAGPPVNHSPLPRLERIGTGEVGRHELIEFKVDWAQAWHNPYDPDEVELDLHITTPGGARRLVPAFFHQPYEHRVLERGNRSSEWIYPAGPPEWRIRFAPDEAGPHTARVVARHGRRSVESEPVAFTCVAKASKGYVRVAREDARFFAFDDGSAYFPIGQNVAFIGSGQYLDGQRAERVFRQMSANGANFARVWVCSEDWALAIEARKSVWGRSWGWQPPVVAVPGREGYHSDEMCIWLGGTNANSVTVSPSHPVALRPDTEYLVGGRVMTEADTSLIVELSRAALGDAVRSEKPSQWTPFKRLFSTSSNQWWLGDLTLRTRGPGRVWLRQLSLTEATGGPELLWEADLRRPVRGYYNQPDSFQLDRLLAAAERHGIYLQLCLLTRDHYMHALTDPASAEYQQAIRDACKLLRYAVARWGHSRHVLAWEYFNEMNPNAPTERFYRELGEYLEQVDIYRHLRTTSSWGPDQTVWSQDQLDIADLHWYMRPVSQPSWQDEVAVVLDRAALVRRQAAGKPALLGEFGLADDKWGRSPHMPQDKAGVHFHNSLWASALSGLSGTAMFWWWETLDQLNLYSHYQPLAAFVADIPFPTAQLQPVTLDTEPHHCRVLLLRGQDRAYGWIFNPQATWWKQVAEKTSVEERKGETCTVDNLATGVYRVQWWDTWQGKVMQEDTVKTDGAKLRLSAPPFTRDLAWKAVRQDAPR